MNFYGIYFLSSDSQFSFIQSAAHNLFVGNADTSFNNIAPSSTIGIPLISNGDSADPSFSTASAIGGGTGINSYTIGDILYCNATNTLSKLNASTDGTVLTMSGGVPVWSSSSSSPIYNVAVDGKTVGNTLMFTSLTGKSFVTTGVFVTVTALAGLTLVATLSVGTNSPNYNNVCAATLLTGLNTQTQILALPLVGTLTSVASNSQVYVRVSIGSTASTYNLNVGLTGYYI